MRTFEELTAVGFAASLTSSINRMTVSCLADEVVDQSMRVT